MLLILPILALLFVLHSVRSWPRHGYNPLRDPIVRWFNVSSLLAFAAWKWWPLLDLVIAVILAIVYIVLLLLPRRPRGQTKAATR
jgi:hypothetical protein